MRITEKDISKMIKSICDLTGLVNCKKIAIDKGHDKYLSYENAAIYGGYRLIMISVTNGAHYGALGYGSTEPRLKPADFANRLKGIIAGLSFNTDIEITNALKYVTSWGKIAPSQPLWAEMVIRANKALNR